MSNLTGPSDWRRNAPPWGRFRSHVSRLWRALLLEWRLLYLLTLAASTWAASYSRLALSPLQEVMRADLLLSDDRMAWLQGAAIAAPMAIGTIPLGVLFNKCSRANFMIFFAALNLVSLALAALSPNLVVLYAARCLTGLSIGAIFVGTYSIVAELYAPERRGRATMTVVIGEIGGAPAAFALGGALLAMRGGGASSWRWALLWMCLPLIVVLVLTLVLRPHSQASAPIRKPSVAGIWHRLWCYRSVAVPLLLARILVWTADGAVVIWAAPAFARDFGLPPNQIGGILAVALLVSGFLGPAIGGPLADMCQRTGGPARTMAAICALTVLSAPAALFAIAPNPAVASVVLTIFLTLGFAVSTVALALVAVAIPSELRAAYISVTVTVGAICGIGMAPLVVSVVATALGGPHMLGKALTTVCVVASVLGSMVFALGRQWFVRSHVMSRVRSLRENIEARELG